MMTRIPRLTGTPTTAAVNTVLAAIEVELSRRPVTVGGQLVVSEDQPLIVASDTGALYRISVDADGAVTTTPVRNPRVPD